MKESFFSKLKHAWNIFTGNTKEKENDSTTSTPSISYGSYYRPDRTRIITGNGRTIITAIFNRIAVDTSMIDIRHVKVNKDNNNFVEEIDSGLNNCLKLEANIDQNNRALIQDAVLTMFDKGCAAIVPIETEIDPNVTRSYDILSMRVGEIIEWFPDKIQVSLYNEKKGYKQNVIVPKKNCAIVENPFYAVVNDSNSVLQRLIRKLVILDAIDEQSGSGKFNLILQLPYQIRTEQRKIEAEKRLQEIEGQLYESKYGIAYTDGTEHIVQLNKTLENNLMDQVKYLTSMLYSQLGITESILDGTADEKVMTNYMNGTISVIVSAIVQELKRKFLTKTARTQGQTIMYFSNPFRLLDALRIAELSDKLTRNEILTANEIRQLIGFKAAEDPGADKLLNKNISHDEKELEEKEENIQNGKSEQEV